MKTSVILALVIQFGLVLCERDESQNEVDPSVMVIYPEQSGEKTFHSVKRVTTEPSTKKVYPVPPRRPVYFNPNDRLEPSGNSQYPDSFRRPVYYDPDARSRYPEPSGRPAFQDGIYTRPTYPEPYGRPIYVDSYGRPMYYYDQNPYYRRNRIDDLPDRFSDRYPDRHSGRRRSHGSGSDDSESEDSSD